ncbi:MAG TPA: hypothetical protein VGG74_24770 [Kofleriaceae bacterium]
MTRRIAVLALACCARLASAQPAGDDASVNKGDARELLQLGVKLLKSKDYLGALAVFQDAYKRFPSAKILLDIGTTFRALGRNAEAANAYQGYLDSPQPDPALVGEVTKDLGELDPSLGKLAITAPAGAELQADDFEWVPASEAALVRVPAGDYVVRARREGDQPFETHGSVAAGQQVAVGVELVAIPKERVVVKVPVRLPPIAQPERPRDRFGLVALGHFDFSGGGAALVGLTFDATSRLEIDATAIVGPNLGGYVGASFAILTGTLRPIICAGLPVFSNDGARYAIRGAAGLEIAANRHFAVIVELGVERDLNPQSVIDIDGMPHTVDKTAFIPALGASARL